MARRFDVVILGGGNAGFGVSAVAHEAGRSIAFVEARDFGGTCPNRGCTPKKVLVAAAHALHEIEAAAAHGIEVGRPRLDWGRLIRREKEIIAGVPEKMAALAGRRGTVLRGHGRFVGPNAVEVDGTVIEGDAIVVATGSRPRPLPIPGAEHMITSDEILSEETLPGSVVFVGGGVIAMEFSHVYARAGATVTILEAMPRLLPRLEADAVAEIRAESERIGIAIHTGVTVTGIVPEGAAFRVRFAIDGERRETVADRVVNGAGRIANVEGLDLGAGNVAQEGGRISTDDWLRSTSNSAVWACGDVLTTSAQLSPLATYEGRIVGRNIVEGPVATADYASVPSCVYTVPALATVGLTEAEAAAAGLDVAVSVNDMRGWFSGISYAETVAWAKVLVEKGSDRIVGHRGEELIHLFALAMAEGMTATRLKDRVFAFPTFSSDLKSLM